MRSTINVLLIDDNEKNIEKFKKPLEKILSKRGYKSNILTASSKSEVKKFLSSKKERIDILISDNNLGKDFGNFKSGVSFLNHIRGSGQISQFFLLYSNVSEDSLADIIIDFLKTNKNSLKNLTNFKYISLPTKPLLIEKELEPVVDVVFKKWDELNALRGEFAYGCSTVDFLCREILKIEFPDKIGKYCNEKIFLSEIQSDFCNFIINKSLCTLSSVEKNNFCNEFEKIKNKRNDLEHNCEKWNIEKEDYMITGKYNIFYEKNVANERIELINFLNLFKNAIINITTNNSKFNKVLNFDCFKEL